MLFHIVYASTALQPFNSQQWLDLLTQARDKNARLGVTGLLLHKAGDFFQVIEGPQAVLASLFATIEADPRHAQVVKIIDEPIARRAFGDWTMASADLTLEELSQVEGLNDFFVDGAMFAKLGAGRARKLITAFDAGRWHSRIDRAVA
jgi:hypothetical protein